MQVPLLPLQLGLGPLLPLLAMVLGLGIIGLVAIGFPDDAIVGGTGLFLSGLTGYLFSPLSGPIGLAAGFLLYTFVFYLVWKRYVRTGGTTSQGSTSDADDLRGERAIVTKRIPPNGKGEIELQGSGKSFFARSETGEAIDADERVLILDPSGGTIVGVAPENYTFSEERDVQTETE